MKKLIFVVIIFFSLYQKSYSTEHFQFYIYSTTTYDQGPWIGLPLIEKGNFTYYLEPKIYGKTFSLSGYENDFAIAIVDFLKELNPERYEFDYSIQLNADHSILFKSKNEIKDFELVKNELIASLVLNGFKAVKIQQGNKSKLYFKKDITIPYFDFVVPKLLKK